MNLSEDLGALASRAAVRLKTFSQEDELEEIMAMITADLSEPYSVYCYRYFVYQWPELCIMAYDTEEEPNGAEKSDGEPSKEKKIIGVIVCKLDVHHKKQTNRGYIAMLAVRPKYRHRKIGTLLVKKAIRTMQEGGCHEVVLETEVCNKAALGLYQNLGFVRDKRLGRYYLNGGDAFRLKYYLPAILDHFAF
jgi:peptide alpha-N-acetyltransferase